MPNKLLSKIYQRFLDVFHSMGWPDGALYIAAQVLGTVTRRRVHLRKYYFVSQPLPVRALPRSRGLSIEVREIDRTHALVGAFPRPPAVISRRFDAGARCFLAMKDGAFAGYLWIQENGYDEDEVRCRFIPQPAEYTIWDFDVFVIPELRNGLAFLRLWSSATERLFDEGYKYSVSRIAAFNPISIESHMRLGAFPVGSAYFLNGGRWQVLFSMSPAFRLSVGRSSTPALQIDATGNRQRNFRRFSKR